MILRGILLVIWMKMNKMILVVALALIVVIIHSLERIEVVKKKWNKEVIIRKKLIKKELKMMLNMNLALGSLGKMNMVMKVVTKKPV